MSNILDKVQRFGNESVSAAPGDRNLAQYACMPGGRHLWRSERVAQEQAYPLGSAHPDGLAGRSAALPAVQRRDADHLHHHRSDSHRQDTPAHRVHVSRYPSAVVSSPTTALRVSPRMISRKNHVPHRLSRRFSGTPVHMASKTAHPAPVCRCQYPTVSLKDIVMLCLGQNSPVGGAVHTRKARLPAKLRRAGRIEKNRMPIHLQRDHGTVDQDAQGGMSVPA